MATNYSEPFIAVISAELMVLSCYQPIIYFNRSKKIIQQRQVSAISLLLNESILPVTTL
jgi:hypothetical protein